MPRPPKRRRYTAAENLEPRVLLSAISLQDKVLTVEGTEFADVVQFDGNPDGSLEVRLNQTAERFEAGEVARIVVRTAGGHDRIDAKTVVVPMTIESGAGNDTVIGGQSDDVVSGGDGNDSLVGGLGDDRLRGQHGDDYVAGDEGSDTLSGSLGTDTLRGGAGRDKLVGGRQSDDLNGQRDKDTLRGGSAADLIVGGPGDDAMYGGAGNDTMLGGVGSDSMHGGFGADELRGEASNDWLNGESGADLLIGGDAQDALFGGKGRDTIEGGAGEDMLVSGSIEIEGTEVREVQRVLSSEWFVRRYDKRINNIRKDEARTVDLAFTLIGTNRDDESQTIFADGHRNRLNGNEGQDYFIISTAGDLFETELDERFDEL